jgi:hypothetical protein
MKLLYRDSLNVTPLNTAHTTNGLINAVCSPPNMSEAKIQVRYFSTRKFFGLENQQAKKAEMDHPPQVSQPFSDKSVSGCFYS